MSKKDYSRRAKLIANPGAGDETKTAERLEQVTRFLLDLGITVDVALAHPVKEAVSIARKAARKGYPTVIAMGGDGTVSAVIRGIVGSAAQLGIIPGGTENDIAASLGIPEDLQEACALISAGYTRDLDLAKISTKKKKDFVFFMVTTVGLTTTLYPHLKDVPHGDFSKLKDAIATVIRTKPDPKIYLTLDGDSKFDVESMLVTITNTPVIGAKNLVAPDASMEDGLLDIAVYPNFSKAELVAYFAMSAHERQVPDGKIQRYRARKIKIRTDPELEIAAEGILLGKGKARIKVLPRALKVVAPPPGAGAEKPLNESAQELPAPVSVTAGTDPDAQPV